MKKHTEPKRKIGKSLETDIEMIERCLDRESKDLESDDNEEEDSYQIVDESESTKSNIRSSKEVKSGFAKSVSWSESEENTPRLTTSTSSKPPQNLGARPKTGRHLNPLVRQKQSLEDGNSIVNEVTESGEESSIFKQESSSSAKVTKTTSVVKRSSSLMEKIRQRSSQSRTRSDISEDEDSSDTDNENQEPKQDNSSSDEGKYKDLDAPNFDNEKEIEEEENKETVGPLKKLSSSRKKSSSSSAGGDKKASKRPALQKQGSRYDIRLREEDHSAQIAFEKRQESRRENSKKHWGTLRDSVHSGSFQSFGLPSKEESYDFFTKVWENTPPINIQTSQQKRRGREEDKQKKKQRRGGSGDDPSGDSDEDMDGEESNFEDSDTPSDERKLLAKDYIGETYAFQLTEFKGPEIISPEKRREQEEELYFTPSTSPVDIVEKMEEGQEPRFLEEEGMYIGVRPAVKKSNQNKVENRILKERSVIQKKDHAAGTKHNPWFGQDGRLVALPNPIQRKATRPPVLDDSSSNSYIGGSITGIDATAFDTVFCPPSMNMPPEGGTGGIAASNSTDLKWAGGGLPHCQLDVDVGLIIFQHHHLFSLEHHLSTKLVDAYHAYVKIRGIQTSKGLDNRINVLYRSLEELKSKRNTWLEEEREFQGHRLKTYREEIRILREERDDENLRERDLVRNIIAIWKEIRNLRTTQKYSNTSHKIIIHKESVNKNTDKKFWDKEIQRELAEHREIHAANREIHIKNYENELQIWKDINQKRKEARKRKKQREKDAEKGEGGADADEMAADDQFLSQEAIKKPEHPKEFDEELVLAKIEKRARSCRRPPGEPKMVLELTISNRKSTTSSENIQGSSSSVRLHGNGEVTDNREINRRNAVAKTKFNVKLFVNGNQVCQSSPKYLQSMANSGGGDFVVHFGQIFPIQILQLPESLLLQVVEQSLLRTTVLAEVQIPLCEAGKTLEMLPSTEPIDFRSNIRFAHDHAGLGSMVDFASTVDGSSINSEPVKGQIFARVGWGKSLDGVVLSPSPNQWKPTNIVDRLDPLKEAMDADGKIDAAKLEAWIIKSQIDPNDSDNEELMSRVTEARRKIETSVELAGEKVIDSIGKSRLSSVIGESGRGYFRLDQHSDQLIFATDEEIERNVRFQMLQLRKNKVPEFKNYRMIPASENEIPRGILEAREKRAAASRREVVGSGDPIRGPSRLYMDRLRAQVSHRFSLARHRRRHGDVVLEDPIPDMSTLLMLIGEMAPAQRPLRPVRTERKKVLMQDLAGAPGEEKIKLLLSVVRAYDVPVRCDMDPLQSQSNLQLQASSGGNVSGVQLNEASVNTYVEARFQGSCARTTTAVGPNPAWNQQLALNFKSSNNDFSADTLSRVKDSLHLHLFDEVAVDLLDNDQERSSHVHQRLEKKWLGSLSIPFSSLYHNTRIEGTFRLHSPAVLLGYERTGNTANVILGAGGGFGNIGSGGFGSGLGGSGADQPKVVPSKNATYLNIYLTIQPALMVPEPVKEKLDCDESEALVQQCEQWSRELASSYPHRKVNPLVADVTGKSVLMTRYFRALEPPSEILHSSDSKLSAENVAWFVSLIPYLPSNALFPGLQGIWPTCDQFLQMMNGSEIEHAVLLANFFSSMGKKTYVVLGKAAPEGDTAYVLSVEENGEQWLWNATTAEQFNISETFCPLECVYAVVNDGNIWGNMQLMERPARLRWSFTSNTDWKPLFGRNFPMPSLPSIQPTELNLTSADPRAAKQLRERLERTLRDSLMNLRKKLCMRTTTMNFQGNAVLRKLLPGLELSHGGLSSEHRLPNADHLSELQRIVTSHKVCGFPLHSAFTDVETLLEALASTGVHFNRESGVEFALAVHVEAYPNTVMSVWVYVASMVRRR